MEKNMDIIGADKLEEIVANTEDVITEVEWNGMTLRIRRNIDMRDMLEFVRDVVESCFVKDTGEYLPEIRDFMTCCEILERYANFELPDDIESRYTIIYKLNVMSTVIPHIDQCQLESITSAISKKIKHRAQSNIEALTKQMNEVTAGFLALEDNLSTIFMGVDGDTITKLASAISNGAFDESKIVDAFSRKHSSKASVM